MDIDTDSSLPSQHCTLRSLTVLRKRLDSSRLVNGQCTSVSNISKEQQTEQRNKLTSLAERIRKVQEVNKQEAKKEILKSRPRPVRLSVVR